MTHSKVLLVAQMPGLGAFAMIWGIHSSITPVAWAVWIAANALVYWPLIFVLSLLDSKQTVSVIELVVSSRPFFLVFQNAFLLSAEKHSRVICLFP
jgi:hypothetical protein